MNEFESAKSQGADLDITTDHKFFPYVEAIFDMDIKPSGQNTLLVVVGQMHKRLVELENEVQSLRYGSEGP